jgi:anti-anti-sigma regulatory factor
MVAQPHPSFTLDAAPGPAQILTLDGAFNAEDAPGLTAEFRRLADDSRTELAIDLRGLTAIDAEMLRELVLELRSWHLQHRQVTLIRPHPQLWAFFCICGIDLMCPSAESLHDALATAPAVAESL